MGGFNFGPDFYTIAVKAVHTAVANSIYQDQFGRDATPDEISRIGQTNSYAMGTAVNAVLPKIPELLSGGDLNSLTAENVAKFIPGKELRASVEQMSPIVFKSDEFRTEAKAVLDNTIATKLKETMGITDTAKIQAVKDKFSELTDLSTGIDAGTGAKNLIENASKAVTNINNMRMAALDNLYAGEYSKVLEGDTERLNENLDEFTARVANADIGLDLLLTDDYNENKQIARSIADTISREYIQKDESVQKIIEDKAAKTEEESPFDAATVTAKLDEARDKLATDLAASEGNRTEALQKAYQEYVDKIPADVEKVKSIAQERLTETLKELPKTFGEFGARLGLGVGESGQLQQALAKETATAGAETDRQIQEYQLGREQEAAQIKLGMDQNIADYQAQRESNIANLGYGIEQLGTQIGREDWQTLLAQQYQQKQIASQQEYNTFLTQMGYFQNQIAQQQQYQQQLGLLGQQQSFQASQNELNRQMEERMAANYQAWANSQQAAARKQSRQAGLQQLGGTLLGAGIGALGGGLVSGGLSAGQGALFGAGIGGGNPYLTAYGAENIFK